MSDAVVDVLDEMRTTLQQLHAVRQTIQQAVTRIRETEEASEEEQTIGTLREKSSSFEEEAKQVQQEGEHPAPLQRLVPFLHQAGTQLTNWTEWLVIVLFFISIVYAARTQY
ncbi:MAG: hypothetical protein IMW91_05860 [Firmicutes bacterium]|nr:hypothetical protein [Bacillota bacterium]